MSSLLYDCNYWATNFITELLFELRGLKGSIGILECSFVVWIRVKPSMRRCNSEMPLD